MPGPCAPCASFDNTALAQCPLRGGQPPAREAWSCANFRFTVSDRPGVLAAIAKTMAEHEISIAQAVQKGDQQAADVPIVFLTHCARASAGAKTIRAIDAMPFALRPTVHFPIL